MINLFFCSFQAAYKSALQQQYEQQQYNMMQRLQGAPYMVQQQQQRPPMAVQTSGAKSTENLISTPNEATTFDSSLSCECLEAGVVAGSPMQEPHPHSHFLSNAAQRKSIDSIFYNSQPSSTPSTLSRNSSVERTNETVTVASRPPTMVEKSEVTRL